MEEDHQNGAGAPAGVNVNGSSHMSMSSEEGSNKKELFFKLQVQKLVEMVREGKVEEALAFARAELAVLGESEEGIGGGGEERLKILEEAMTLLVFGAAGRGGGGGGEKGLLDLAHRASLANEANAAILQSQGQDSEPVLVDLVRQWQVMVEEMSKGR
jgi:hypothetical protein